MDSPQTLIIRRAGVVLLVIGFVDIAVMLYCIANGISYRSSFNIFAVIAGIFLMRGSLRAASVIRWCAVFTLAVIVPMLFAWPFMQPFSLTLMQIRLTPGALLTTVLFMGFVVALTIWLARELGREPIMVARAEAGRKQRDMRIPAALGIVMAIVMGIFMIRLLGGESADRARSMVAQHVGPGFQLHVNSLHISKSNHGTFVSSVVIAWNETEMKYVPVRWKE